MKAVILHIIDSATGKIKKLTSDDIANGESSVATAIRANQDDIASVVKDNSFFGKVRDGKIFSFPYRTGPIGGGGSEKNLIFDTTGTEFSSDTNIIIEDVMYGFNKLGYFDLAIDAEYSEGVVSAGGNYNRYSSNNPKAKIVFGTTDNQLSISNYGNQMIMYPVFGKIYHGLKGLILASGHVYLFRLYNLDSDTADDGVIDIKWREEVRT